LLIVGLQVNLSADKQTIEDYRPDDDNALLPVEELGELFPSPLSKRNIHIVVRAPSDGAYRNIPKPSDRPLNVSSGPVPAAPSQIITLNCWVLSDDPDRVFPVDFDARKSVGALKDEIKKKKSPIFDDMPADRLDLWKVSERVAQSPPLIKPAGVYCSRGPRRCAADNSRSSIYRKCPQTTPHQSIVGHIRESSCSRAPPHRCESF
jgi:hypothetical protein